MGEQNTNANAMMATMKQQADAIQELNKRVKKLEDDQLRMFGLMAVKDRVSELLLERISKLEQYTRRYSVVIRGIPRQQNETRDGLRNEVLNIIEQAECDVSAVDVDKLHRNGPKTEDNQQEVIVRFKSHTAKETFYKNRKTIKAAVKVQPSLNSENKAILEEARKTVESFAADESLTNPPHFVFADVHVNLQVKMHEPTKGSMFHRFSSIQNLYEILIRCNANSVHRFRNQMGNPDPTLPSFRDDD